MVSMVSCRQASLTELFGPFGMSSRMFTSTPMTIQPPPFGDRITRYRQVGCGEGLAVSVRQLAQPSLEKSPFWFLLREAQGSFIGGTGFRYSPEPTAEVRPCCMR